ncbi:DUF4113 domain-containing protein [Pseudomonas marginalis]
MESINFLNGRGSFRIATVATIDQWSMKRNYLSDSF